MPPWQHGRYTRVGDLPAPNPSANPVGETEGKECAQVASNRPAQSTSSAPSGTTTLTPGFAPGTDEGPWEEWNPTEDSLRSVRGRHRVTKQRGGGLARSFTVLGVGVMAAVGAGGMATAQTGKPPVSISLPDLSSLTESAKALVGDGTTAPKGSATALSSVGLTDAD